MKNSSPPFPTDHSPGRIIGIVGTAKNTGKTAALVSMIKALHERDRRTVAVTGIGYDGELVDSLTFLPKPRIELPSGSLVATAERCAIGAHLKAEVLQRTGIETSLGEVLILKVTAPGRIIVAGPNQKSGLIIVNRMLFEAGADLILVDGALGRMAPMTIADGIIISTGAARTTSIDKLSEEIRAIHHLLSLPGSSGKDLIESNSIAIQDRDGRWRNTQLSTLLDSEQSHTLLDAISSQSSRILFPALVMIEALEELTDGLRQQIQGLHFVFANPFVLLLGGEPVAVEAGVRKISDRGGEVRILSSVPLLAVTVNPFYPRRFRGNRYASAYIDKEELKQKISATLPVPVIDVQTDGPDGLLKACRLMK